MYTVDCKYLVIMIMHLDIQQQGTEMGNLGVYIDHRDCIKLMPWSLDN